MSDDIISLGMVGVGGWGRFVVRNFNQNPNCTLKYICDANEELLARQAVLYPSATLTTEFQTILDDDGVDAVAIVTPAPTHYALAKAALLAGKHVYVEKPMTLTAEHSQELVELSEELGLKLMVGHLLEYHPAVARMKSLIDSGELGDLHYMYCQRLNLGVVRNNENAFWSLAPHDISIILYLFGAEPDSIEVSGQSYLQPGIEDVVFATLHFPDGRMANVHVSWLDPHKTRSMVVVGSEKMLVFDDMQPTEKIRVFEKKALVSGSASGAIDAIAVRHGDILSPHIPTGEPLAIEVAHFIDAILNNTTPRSDGHDGLRVVRILEEVDRKLRQQYTIPIRKVA